MVIPIKWKKKYAEILNKESEDLFEKCVKLIFSRKS